LRKKKQYLIKKTNKTAYEGGRSYVPTPIKIGGTSPLEILGEQEERAGT